MSNKYVSTAQTWNQSISCYCLHARLGHSQGIIQPAFCAMDRCHGQEARGFLQVASVVYKQDHHCINEGQKSQFLSFIFAS